MKKILIFAAALCVLAACNKDEIKEANKGAAIDFRVAVNTKATELTTANLDKFMVTALTDEGATYFADVEFAKEEQYFTSGTSYYWPASGNLKFYAYYPTKETLGDDVTLTISSEATTLTGYTPDTDISNQLDIIIANATGNKENNEDNGVEIEFAHQLAKVEVWAVNTNSGYTYSVKGVRIANVYPTGDLDFSSASVWTEKGDKTTYEVQYDERSVTATAATLMASDTDNAMLIPQNTEKWDIEGDAANTEDGSYLSILVQVNTTAGSRVFPAETDDPNDDEYEWMAVPVDFNWEPGYKYVYTLNLGTGSGYTESGDEILGGMMSFNVYVGVWDSYYQNVAM